jgi:hypothetical protein
MNTGKTTIDINEQIRPKPTIEMFKEDVEDSLMVIPPSRDVELIDDFSSLPDIVNNMLEKYGELTYTTGGYEGSLAHIQVLHHAVGRPVLLGLEQDSYIRKKGREPLYSLEKRKSIWKHLLYPGSRIFEIPEDLKGEDYDQLAKDIGVYKREGVYYLTNRDDSPAIKYARAQRCFSKGYLQEIHYGHLHTSNYSKNFFK